MTIFPSYQKQLKEALKSFLDEAWPCEALHPKTGQRCVVVQATHKTKGHQLANGKVWSGDYCSSQPSDIQSTFVKRVRSPCQSLWKKVMEGVQTKGLSGIAQEQQIAFEIHQQEIIRSRCEFLHGQSYTDSVGSLATASVCAAYIRRQCIHCCAGMLCVTTASRLQQAEVLTTIFYAFTGALYAHKVGARDKLAWKSLSSPRTLA